MAARHGLTLAGFLVLTVVMTAPLAWRGGRSGPVNTGDGQWSMWSTAWVARTLLADPWRLYDANIFAPHPRTLAYSETNLAGGLLAAPAWWTTRDPYVTYSAAVFLSFFLSAIATFGLVHHLTRHRGAAVVSAVAFAFAPFVVVRLAHVQLLMTFCLPLALLALHRLVERQSAARVLTLSAALVVAGWCSGYYAIFTAIAVGLGFLYYGIARGLWRRPRPLIAGASAIVIAGIAILPFVLPYLELGRGDGPFRTIEESRRYSADWRSYLTSTTRAHRAAIHAFLPFEPSAFPERVLFPGFVAAALAGVALAWAGRRPPDGRPRRVSAETAGFYALLGGTAAWLSFGPAGGLYAWLYQAGPVLSMLRAPSRFGALVMLALAVLAGLATAALAGRLRSLAVAPVAVLLLLGELAAVPFDLRPALDTPAVYRALAALPAGVVAEFPFFFREQDFHRNTLYMLHSTRHWRPLVNGYSDRVPVNYGETAVAISTFPSREAFRLLRERGAKYVVFHLQLYDHRSRAKLLDALDRYRDYLRPLQREDDVWLYEIVGWPAVGGT